MGIFFNWLDKKALQAFNVEMENNVNLPIEGRIIVAEMIEQRYERTLEIMKLKSKKEIENHLHIEGKEAGERLLRLQKENNGSEFHICKIAEARLSEVLYHCLQCEKHENVLYASNQIMEYILTLKVQRFAYEEEILEILRGDI